MNDAVLTRSEGRVLELTLNRPGAGNAFDDSLVEGLIAALDSIDGDACDTVVFRGNGKGFCGGLNLSGLVDETDASLLWRFVRIELLLQKVASLPQDTVALAHRFAFGAGADLFMACNRRIAAPGTKFSFPGVRFGIVLGTRRLAHRLGPEAARRMLAATAPIPLETAQEVGMVQETVPDENWPALVTAVATASSSLDARMARLVAERFNPGKDDADMAALVPSAAEPGLKDRIAAYAAAVAAARKGG